MLKSAAFVIVMIFVSGMFVSNVDAMIPQQSALSNYISHDMIVVGKITKVNEIPEKNVTQYTIQVEKYLKKPQKETEIAAFGSGTSQGPSKSLDKHYQVGQRVVLFLKYVDGDNVISPYSINAEVIDADRFIPSPLKISKAGIPVSEIVCKNDLVLVIKINSSPACVNHDSINKLKERNWIKSST